MLRDKVLTSLMLIALRMRCVHSAVRREEPKTAEYVFGVLSPDLMMQVVVRLFCRPPSIYSRRLSCVRMQQEHCL